MSTHASPTISETALRFWNSLPSLLKALIPSLAAILIVLLPANFVIGLRFYEITMASLRAEHQALLAEIGRAFDDLFGGQALYLAGLASQETIRACAAEGCTAQSGGRFREELVARLNDPNTFYIELGFLDLAGRQTARAMRGGGGALLAPGDLLFFEAGADHAARMQTIAAGQAYSFPISRDPRISPSEAYQQPALRFVVPVFAEGQRAGYVTSLIGLDDFFTLRFVHADAYELLLLDTERCLLASSDDSRRPELYKTWSGAPERTCYPALPAPDWNISGQEHRLDGVDTVFSTYVLHGPLSLSGQSWTIVIQEPKVTAYAQANALQTLLTIAHLVTVVFVAALIIAADRAVKRLASAEQARLIASARNMRFNPYIVGAPVDDPELFFGRTEALAQVLGMGVMGGNNVLIIGDRRIGKTSVLRQVERRLRERRLSDPLYWYWPVVLSAQGIPAGVFYGTLMEAILRSVENREARADLRYHQHSERYGPEDFHIDLNEILTLPNPDGQLARLVICLDNVHFWLDEAAGYDAAFRMAFYHLFEAIGSGLTLIAAGSRAATALFDSTVSVVSLGVFSPDEAARLVREPVAAYYTFSDEAVAYILEHSNLLPLEVGRLARHATQVMLEQEGVMITRGHAERAFRRAIADWEPTFRLLWHGGIDKTGQFAGGLSESARTLLRGVALSDGVLDPARYGDDAPLLAHPLLDEIAFTDAQGRLRLKAVFRAWLAR